MTKLLSFFLLLASLSAQNVTFQGSSSSSSSASYPTVVTPEQYGAVRDGSTDDRSAIQSAIAALASTGGTVLLAAGNYKITAALTITTNNITIRGSGVWGTVIENSATTGNSISISGTSYTGCAAGGSVVGIKLEGFHLTRTTAATAGYGVSITNACRIVINDVTVTDSFHGFGYNRVGNPTFFRSWVLWGSASASARYGYDIDTTSGGSYTVYCTECVAAAGGGSAGVNTKGLYVHGPNVSDIQFDGFETAFADYGVDLALTSQNASMGSDIRIINPILDNDRLAAIRITGTNSNPITWSDVKISNGYFLLNAANAVGILIDTMAGVGVTNTNVNCNGQTGSIGISVTNASSEENRIVGNRTSACTTGIKLDAAITTTVTGNVFQGPGTTGILTTNSANGNIISSNIVRGSYTNGISLDSIGYNIITGNYLAGVNTNLGPNFLSTNSGFPSAPTVATCGTIGTGSSNRAGFITSNVAGTCGAVLTFVNEPAATGWSCRIDDSTTPANKITQTGSTTTTATFTGTTANNDVLRFSCTPY